MATSRTFVAPRRFTAIRRLGSGGFGEVYEALDRDSGARVALKALRRKGSQSLYRFKQEFRALADLQHPNLVAFYELFTEDDRWFLTMELVDGVDFLSWVRGESVPQEPDSEQPTASVADRVPSPSLASAEPTLIDQPLRRHPAAGAPLPPPASPPRLDRLRPALAQLARGLRALHGAARLHCDIKPSNVLVDPAGRVVLLDFGLVAGLDAAVGPEIAGTPLYMAPEQAGGGRLSEASDWYSVGVMLYQALTGVPPYQGTTREILAAKKRELELAPSRLVGSTPPDLDELCRELLRRDAERRPDGTEAARRLGAPAEETGAAVGRPAPAPRFVGREHHLEALAAALAALPGGAPVAVAVSGRSGMGKTALVRHFLQRVRREFADAVLLEGRCYEQESVPFKALDSLMDALAEHLKTLPPESLAAVLPPDLPALARVFAVFHGVPVTGPVRERLPGVLDSLEARRRAFAALRQLFAGLAARAPLVLFLDDLQWGDVDSAALLEEVLRPPDPPALLWLGAYRSEDLATSPFLGRWLRARQRGEWAIDTRDLAVAELSPQEAEAMAVAVLGDGVERDRARVIARESGGNPLFVDALARHAGGAATGLDAAPPTLRDVLRLRLGQLPEPARRLVEAVSVAGRPVDLALAARVAGLGAAAAASLPLLRSQRLLRLLPAPAGERVETYHDRIREVVTGELPAERRQAYHAALARELQTSAAGRADPEAIAVHLREAGEREAAAEFAALAARRSAEALAFDRAARLYREALDLRPGEGAERRELQVRLGDALASAGRGPEAAEAFLQARTGAATADAIELRRRAADQLLRSGRIDRGLEEIALVLGELGMRLARTPRRALPSLVLRRLLIRLRGLSFRRRDSTQISPERLIRIDTCWSVAVGLGMVDTIRGAEFQTRHLLLALDTGEPYRIARALATEAAYSAVPGTRAARRTARLVALASQFAEQVQDPHVVGLTTLMSALAAFLGSGHYRRALELAERAEACLRERCTGVAWELDTSQHYSLLCRFFLGEWREMARRLPALLAEAKGRGDLYADNLLTRFAWVERLLADDPAAARAHLRGSMAHWSVRGFHLQHWWSMLGEVQLDLYEGDGPGAHRRVLAAWPALAGSLLLRVQFVHLESLHLRARAAIAAALAAPPRDAARWLRAAERDARRIEREGMAAWTAQAGLVHAALDAVRGERGRAIVRLEQAERMLAATDQALAAAAARRRLGELCGGEPGRALVAEAEERMRAEGIARPERVTAMLAPGRFAG